MLSSVSDYRPEIRDILVAISFALLGHSTPTCCGCRKLTLAAALGLHWHTGRQELSLSCDLHKVEQFHQQHGQLPGSSSIAKDGYNWPKAATIYQRRLPFVLTTNAVNNQTPKTVADAAATDVAAAVGMTRVDFALYSL